MYSDVLQRQIGRIVVRGNQDKLRLNLSFEEVNNLDIFQLVKYVDMIETLEKEIKDG